MFLFKNIKDFYMSFLKEITKFRNILPISLKVFV